MVETQKCACWYWIKHSSPRAPHFHHSRVVQAEPEAGGEERVHLQQKHSRMQLCEKEPEGGGEERLHLEMIKTEVG